MNFKKANAIVVTLFITLLVGLIGLVITKYVVNLIKISSENLKYYKAYYTANAGLELELLKIKNHGFGFEDSIVSGSSTVTSNFSGLNYGFEANVKSMSKDISKSINLDCTDENMISLGTGQGLMIPLTYDVNHGENVYSGIDLDISDISNLELKYDGDIVLAYNSSGNNIVKNISGNGSKTVLIELGITQDKIEIANKPFIVVGAKVPSKICLYNYSKVVTPYTLILSQGTYRDRKVTLKIEKHNKWADFAIYGLY